MNAEIPALNANDIHLWFAYPREIRDVDLLDSYKEIMNEEERHQQEQFYFQRHRHHYLITRALVRSVLPYYVDIPPQSLEFKKNKYGRPELAKQPDGSSIRFNISHTDGLVMCGVTLDYDLGVDTEDMKRPGQTIEIADRFFSPQEVTDLNMLSENQRKDRFFDYWTLKEAYIKACGMGLSIPLDDFSFNLSAGQPIRISFHEQRKDDPDLWQFWLLNPSDRHRAAVGIKASADQSFDIRLFKTVPLTSVESINIPIAQNL